MRIGAKGREFRSIVADEVWAHEFRFAFKSSDRLRVDMLAIPPDNRRRDLDNIFKALFDALGHAEIFPDDSQIKKIVAEMGASNKPGGVHVLISKIDEPIKIIDEMADFDNAIDKPQDSL